MCVDDSKCALLAFTSFNILFRCKLKVVFTVTYAHQCIVQLFYSVDDIKMAVVFLSMTWYFWRKELSSKTLGSHLSPLRGLKALDLLVHVSSPAGLQVYCLYQFCCHFVSKHQLYTVIIIHAEYVVHSAWILFWLWMFVCMFVCMLGL